MRDRRIHIEETPMEKYGEVPPKRGRFAPPKVDNHDLLVGGLNPSEKY